MFPPLSEGQPGARLAVFDGFGPGDRGPYTPENIPHLNFLKDISFSRAVSLHRGAFSRPCTGGVSGPCACSPGWVRRKTPTSGSIILWNRGRPGLAWPLIIPTLMGYDSDSPKARGEIGKCGVAIDTLKDMEILFDGIPIDKVTTSMTINPPASILSGHVHRLAEKQRGVQQEDRRDDSERYAQGVHRPEDLHVPAGSPPCDSSATRSNSGPKKSRSGIRSASAATTSGRRGPRRFRSWPSRWPMESPTWRPSSTQGA